MRLATLFPPTPAQEVDLHLPGRRDVWLPVTRGVRIRVPEVRRPRDPDRRQRCKRDLRAFAETYLSAFFYDPCPYHLETLQRLQEEILCKTPLVFKSCDAAPRSGGKTTIRRIAALWAVLYRHEACVAFGSFNGDNAENHVKTIKHWLHQGDVLAEDFPEICGWVRKIRNDPKRASPVDWSDKQAKLPNGTYLVAQGIFAGLVGFNIEGLRPNIVFLDDVETLETVESETTTKRIGRTIDQQLLFLPDQHRRAIIDITGTVRTEGCNVTRYTDPEASPGWNSRREAGIRTFPERVDLWEQWVSICRRLQAAPPEALAVPDADVAWVLGMPLSDFGLIRNEGLRDALKFYLLNREEMERGVDLFNPALLPTWKCYRVLAEEGQSSFTTEIQNEVFRDDDGREVREWNVAFIRSHCSDYGARELPSNCDADLVTLGADVHSHGIYYVFRAWRMDGTSWGIEQGVSEVHVWRDAHDVEKKKSLLSGMQRLWDITLRGWRAGATVIPFRFGFIDESWETDTVRYFCEDKQGLLYPVRGEGGANRKVFQQSSECDYTVNVGVDHFKHRLARLLGVVRHEGDVDRGYFYLPSDISLGYCKHMCAERWQPKGRAEGTDVKEYEWKAVNRNNHWWDCEVYALAAAVVSGVKLVGEAKPARREPEPSRDRETGGWISSEMADVGGGDWIGGGC